MASASCPKGHTMNTPSATLARFAAELRFDDLPEPVVRKTEDLLVDWFGSVVAGHGARPVEAITRFALATGPEHGPSEVVNARRGSSPYLAAMANAPASTLDSQLQAITALSNLFTNFQMDLSACLAARPTSIYKGV